MASASLAVPGEPPGRPPVQRRHLFRQPPAQFQPQQISEQVVVPKPRPFGVQRYHERVRVLQAQQDPFRTWAASQQIGQVTIDPVEQSGAQEQMLHIVWLAFEHFGDQVFRDRALAAGELRYEPLRVGVIGKGKRRQPQSRDPPFSPLCRAAPCRPRKARCLRLREARVSRVR